MFGFAPVRLLDVATYAKARVSAESINADTYIGVDNLLPDKQGKTSSSYVPAEGQLIAYEPEDVLIGNIRPYLKKIWFAENDGATNGDVLAIRADWQIIRPRFLYHVLATDSFFAYDMQHAKGAKMPRGDKAAVMDYAFTVPSTEEQDRIIDILDRFDTLCNDISTGLPAEIEARQKQYEYYRDKILTFKELST